jgi:hypothetical protein
MYLTLIETSGNQSYIFATNKLKENFGASELTYRAGTRWVLEAVREAGGPDLWDENPARLRRKLLDPALNRPIDEKSESMAVEVIVATSGKALLLTHTHEVAKKIVRETTARAQREAPGLDLFGVSLRFDWNQNRLGEVNRDIHRLFESERASHPGPMLRSLRLPVVDACATSGLPANIRVENPEGEFEPLSRSSQVKAEAGKDALNRIEGLLRNAPEGRRLPANLDVLEKRFDELDWLGVVHADGNGLGDIFLRFHEHIRACTAADNRRYVERLRRFSLALDRCTELAFLEAASILTPDKRGRFLPLVPLVLGGDDLTVICDGEQALEFTHKFLCAFEDYTARGRLEDEDGHDRYGGIVPELAKNALGQPRLSACAGVAIVKRHFPFSLAYDLAAELIKEAKRVKSKIHRPGEQTAPWPCSALDFHVLYDSSAVKLDDIRGRMTVDEGTTVLHSRPFVVTPPELLTGATGSDWAAQHRIERLQNRIDALNQCDEDGRRALPNSQMHQLRSGLFLGHDQADARFRLIYNRYEKQGLRNFNQSGDEQAPSLFRVESDGVRSTTLLDALDAAAFYGAPSRDEDEVEHV